MDIIKSRLNKEGKEEEDKSTNPSRPYSKATPKSVGSTGIMAVDADSDPTNVTDIDSIARM